MASTSTNPEVVAARDAEIKELLAQGLHASQIAMHLRITERTVLRAKKRLGLPIRQMAPPLSAEEIRIALNLLEDGASYGEVARTLDRDLKTISTRFRGKSKCTPRAGFEFRQMLKMLESLPVRGVSA